jgi:hypothetical protein
MRREVPMIILATTAVIYIVSFFIPHPPMDSIEETFSNWYLVVAAFAIFLGVLNLMQLSLLKVVRKRQGWIYAAVIIVSFLVMVYFGMVQGWLGLLPEGGSYEDPGTAFSWMFDNVYSPLSAMMFALLAFFVASASYRAFRARSKEATMLLVSGFVVMLGRVSAGDWISSWMPKGYWLSDAADWIMNYPNTAGQRAIMIGIALGVVSTSLRLILGLERSYLGGGE